MNASIKIFCLLFVLALGLQTSAQQKIEKEYRIKASMVPKKAIDFIQECFPDTKVKWHKEEGNSTYFLEAKLRFGGYLYSVKFNTDGTLLDTEYIISFNQIPDQARLKIENHLKERFTSFSIKKVQVQWLADETITKKLIDKVKVSDLKFTTNFEIEVRGKHQSQVEFYEFLFSSKGELLKEYTIIQRNPNNLIF